MNKRLALIIWLIPWALSAQVVPAVKAAEIARSVMGGSQLSLKTGLVQDSLLPLGKPDFPDAYVVTFKPAGFVIVSARESTIPILGYSLTSRFPENPDHPLRSWLLPEYATGVILPAQIKQAQSPQFSTNRFVLPLTSAQWGQGDPWNRYCPSDINGKKALAGCVAVAMSQIMEKWHWPLKGAGSVSYTPLHHSEYGKIQVNFDTTHYYWDLTHDIFPTEASAMILFHTGAASLTIYDPVSSSTSVDRLAMPALINNFSYNREMSFREMQGSTLPVWIRMLHQELDNNRPVLYSGTSPDGKSSHAFIIDGYRNETFFHFNWGWNGAGDGWYTLSGMAGGGSDFSSQQGAIFGIQPDNIPVQDRPSAVEALAGDGFIQLFWDRPAISGFSHVNIYRDDSLIHQTAQTKFRDEGLENGRQYTYRVTASYQGETPVESLAAPTLTGVPWVRMQPEYSQTFESGPAGWQFQDSEAGFQMGTAASLRIGANSGKIAAIRSEGHPPGEQVADYLISPVFYPGDFSHPAVSFDYVFKQNPGIDHLTLIWRDFNTGQWQTIAILDSTGGYDDWKNIHLYLPGIAENIPIQIAFLYNDSFGQGFGAAIDNFTIYEVAVPANPDFSIDHTDLCMAQAVTFTDQSNGTVQSWEWDFGNDAEPRYATTQGPHLVRYAKAGKKSVKLVLNHLDQLVLSDALLIREKPEAAFDFIRESMDVHFIDKSSHSEHLLWLFGDGTTSTESNPVHSYRKEYLYEVRQIAYQGDCTPDTLTVFMDMRPGTGIDQEEPLTNLSIYPNPANGQVTLHWNTIPAEPVNIRILSTTSRIFFSQKFSPKKEITVDLNNLPVGLYILQIASGRLLLNKQIIKISN